MPKTKSSKSARKRFSLTASGKVKDEVKTVDIF